MKTIRIAAVVFIMMVFLIPPMTASAASCGETVRQSTEAELRAVSYENNETIAALLAPSWSGTEILNKINEIAGREGKSPADITDDQAVRELNLDNVKTMSFEDAFAEVQAEIGSIIQRIVDSTDGAEAKGAEFFTNKILQNKEKLLLGLTYLERLYDFNMGEQNIRDMLLYESKPYRYIYPYGMIDDVLGWLIYIGDSKGDTLKLSNNANVFGDGKLFGLVTKSTSLEAFLEENRKKYIPDTPMNEWFLQESRAYIVEKPSAWDSNNAGLYKRLYDDVALRAHILPLLTVSENSVYVIANSAAITYGIVDCYVDRNLRKTDPPRYAQLCAEFQQQAEQSAKQQKEFLDCWYRIAKAEKRGMLSSNRIVLDSLRIDPDSNIQWSDKFGANAALGVREFFAPLNLYATYMFADGMAEGEGIRYYVSKALTERGLSTYAHEMTHLLVSEVMLNGYGPRDGMLAEVYTRGMFEPYEINDPPAFNLNLIYDRQAVSDRYHNGRPERFQNEADLQSYMSGILDVVYTLDYAEAEVMLTKSGEEKMKWFHKLEQIEDPDNRYNQGETGSKHNLDSVRELTATEANGLNSIGDLIDNSIIASRYEVNGTKTTGTVARNGYYVVPLFSANYAGVQNNYGVSGDIMIRRQAFELLAEYGYYGGLVPYISNQYKEAAKSEQTILSDQYVLQKIFNDDYGTMADFKKAMFQKRIEKVSQLKPITIRWKNKSVSINNFEDLRLLMKEAIESDLENSKTVLDIRAQATEVERLKQAIFKAYLIQTKDFSDSIYGADTAPIEPSEPGEPTTEQPEETGEPTTEQPEETGEPTTVQPGKPVEPTTVQPGKPGEPTTVQPGNPGEPTTVQPEEPGEPTTVQPEEPGEPTTEQPENPGEPTTVQPGGTETGKKEIASKILLCRVSFAKASHTIRWNSVKSADGYEIYGTKSNGTYKRLQTVSKKADSWKHKKLKKGTQYKYYVKAYKRVGGKRVTLAKSLPVYSTTKGGKYSNASKISVRETRVSVKSGKRVRTYVNVTGKKLSKAGKKVRYVSSNPSVARVSEKGVITGKKPGSCTIYCISQNGLYKKVTVSVSAK